MTNSVCQVNIFNICVLIVSFLSSFSKSELKVNILPFPLNESKSMWADYHSVTPSRNANSILLPLSLGLPSPHRGMLGWKDGRGGGGVGGLLSVVSFSSCMSHPAVSFALFVTPTQLREAWHPHTHQYALQSCSPYVGAVHLWHLIYLAESSPMRLTRVACNMRTHKHLKTYQPTAAPKQCVTSWPL